MKNTLINLMRTEHFMRRVAVKIKSLKKQRQKPVRHEKYEDDHYRAIMVLKSSCKDRFFNLAPGIY